mmetsp:Transcript_15113/g.23067  ORF Transcript_15113/g.23067 Transcript_15113/m.23067 type:complete len:98 (+) Transcript_15113:3-296(+)
MDFMGAMAGKRKTRRFGFVKSQVSATKAAEGHKQEIRRAVIESSMPQATSLTYALSLAVAGSSCASTTKHQTRQGGHPCSLISGALGRRLPEAHRTA